LLASVSGEGLEVAEAEASGLAEPEVLELAEDESSESAEAEALSLSEVEEGLAETEALSDVAAEELAESASTLELAESVQADAPKRIATSASITSKRDTGVDRLLPLRARCRLLASASLPSRY